MKKIVLTIVIVIAALAGIFYVINKNKAMNLAQTEVVAQKNTGVAVRIAAAAFQDMNLQYTANGTFLPKQEVMISAETPGRVVSVLVKEGSYVSAGQTLAVIKGDKQNVAVSNAQAVYNNAKAEVARFENAYTSGGVTKQQLDQVKLQLENAKNNLRSAELNATDVNIKASFAGIVNSKTIEPGSYVNPGQQLFNIVNIGTLKLKVNVDEKTVGTIKLGQNVLVESAAVSGEKFSGVVTFIAPKGDASLNFPVEIEIRNNPSKMLKAGMYGTAIFGNEQLVSALVVPRTAFVGNVSSNKVFVAKDGKAELREVVVGRNFGENIEIVSGIESGEQVITTGQINLMDGSPIEIIK
jgi:membrane fusion protein (multidrug efflux system)